MTGIIQSKGGGGERCTEIRDIEVPDLWHIYSWFDNLPGDMVDLSNPKAQAKQVLECWHLTHDMKNCLQVLDKVLPKMLGRATDRLKEYITDIQEMGDIEQRTVDNLEQWAEELDEFVGIFSHFTMGGDFMASERSEAEEYIKDALKLRDELKKEVDIDIAHVVIEKYLCHYTCSCNHQWLRTWACACNDKCPKCNLEIEPDDAAEVES